MTWHEDLPPLLLRALEPEIKRWAAGFLRTGKGNTLRIVPPELALVNGGGHQVVEFQIVRQMHARMGAIRVVVAPRSADDLRRMQEWSRRHERFTAADFARHRRMQG